MKRTEMIALILSDLTHGEPQTAIGALDYYVEEKKIPLSRIVKFLERRFQIPRPFIIKTLKTIL